MANPPGMKTFHLEVSETEAVHVYSDAEVIWLQLRRNVPTETDVKTPSFKAALQIEPKHAHELGLELLNIAQRFYKRRKAAQQTEKQKKQMAKTAVNNPQILGIK